MKVLEGIFTGAGRKVAFVASRFNELVVSKLVGGARDAWVRHGVDDGALTSGVGARRVRDSAGRQAGGLGPVRCGHRHAVIRGSTPHFDYVAAEVSKGVAGESLRTGVPIVFES